MNKRLYHWLVVLSCCGLSTASLGLCVNCAGVFFAPVAQALNVGIGDVSVFVTILNLANGFLGPVAVKLTKKVNVRVLIGISGLTACMGFVGLSRITALWQLYALALIIGISNAFYGMVLVTLLIGNWFRERMGLAVGIALSFSGLMGAVMSPVFSSLIDGIGWRNAYLTAALVILAAVLPALIFVRLQPGEKGLLPYGASETEQEALKAKTGKETRRSFAGAEFGLLLVVSALCAALSAFGSHMSGYGTSIGLTATAGAYMISATMMGNTVSKLLIGILSDAVGPKKACILITGLTFGGFTILAVFASGPMALLVAGAFLVGTSYSIGGVGLSNMSKALFGQNFASAYSYITAASFVGSAVAVAAIGYSFDMTGSYLPALIAGLIFAIVSILSILLAYRLHGRSVTR